MRCITNVDVETNIGIWMTYRDSRGEFKIKFSIVFVIMSTLIVSVEDAAMLANIKAAIEQLRGVASVTDGVL